MSVRILSGVFRDSLAEVGARLTLIAIADNSHDDGVAWPDEDTIATKTRLSVATVRRSLRTLEKLGEIEVRKAQRGRRRINVYRVLVGEPTAVDYARLPFDIVGPFTTAHNERPSDTDDRSSTHTTTAHPRTDQDSDTSLYREPSVEPSEDLRARNIGRAVAIVTRRGWSVARVPVTEDEDFMARAVLLRWNQDTGQALSSQDWLAKIVMRLREHPELSFDDHADLIAANLRPENAWWKGPATPSVIYGSGAQFERAMLTAQQPAQGGDGAFEVAMREADRIEAERQAAR